MATTTTVTRTYLFESAHWLPHVAEDHKCHRLHGHSYLMEVTAGGPVDDAGFIIDFWDMDKAIQPIIDQIDHRCLNDIPGLQNPTAELIAAWFLDQLSAIGAVAVSIWETRDCYATATVGAS